VRAVGEVPQLDELERLAQGGEIDAGRCLKRAHTVLGHPVDPRGKRAARRAAAAGALNTRVIDALKQMNLGGEAVAARVVAVEGRIRLCSHCAAAG
jgi:hypothetical protein